MAIDLNKKRAARKREGKQQPVVVTFGKETFKLPPELPFEAVSLIGQLDDDGTNGPKIFSQMLVVLLGDQLEKFMAQGPSMADIMELVFGLTEEYGLTLGESPASTGS